MRQVTPSRQKSVGTPRKLVLSSPVGSAGCDQALARLQWRFGNIRGSLSIRPSSQIINPHNNWSLWSPGFIHN